MVKDFRAITHSGATYTVTHGRVHIHGSSLPDTVFTVYEMYSHADPKGLPWAGDKTWVAVDAPVVGERLAIIGRDEWRLPSVIRLVNYDEV